MILKRPFAFLIKHFRLIHGILSVFISYLVFKTSAMLSFITDYSVLPTKLIEPKTTNALFPVWIYFVPAILIIGYIVIMVLMKFKEKPITFYFISILSMIFTIGIYAFAHQTATGLEIELTDVRNLKLNQDLIQTVQILQFMVAVFTIVRATGFNIKKFNFSRDLEEFAIEDEDSEEFEVNLEVDGDSFKRNWRKFKRNAKYVLAENKTIITIFSIFIIIGIGAFIYLNKFVYHKIYKLGETIKTNDFHFVFKESYKTLYDYKENFNRNTAYVIVNFDVQNIYGSDRKLEVIRLYLNINGHSFQHDRKKEEQFFDLGKAYNNEQINNNKQNFNLIYEIPSTFMNDEMYLIYEDITGKKSQIKITPTLLNPPQTSTKYKIADTVNFKESILKNSALNIKSFIVNDYYKNTYQFCLSENNCYESAEYIMPTFTDNYEKALMKIDAELKIDENLDIRRLNGFITFLDSFAKLHYKINGEEKIEDNFKIVVPKNTNYSYL